MTLLVNKQPINVTGSIELADVTDIICKTCIIFGTGHEQSAKDADEIKTLQFKKK